MDYLNPYTIINIPLLELLRNLAIGLVIAVVWAFTIGKTTRLVVDTRQYYPIFILLIPSMIIIISIIKSSIALSLGLVGALSIVRFRTPIKEPEELLYIFVAIAIGLGLGANQVLPTVIGFVVVALSIAPFYFVNGTAGRSSSYLLDISVKKNGDTAIDTARVIAAVSQSLPKHKIKRIMEAKTQTEFLIEAPAVTVDDFDAVRKGLGQITSDFEISLMDNARVIT